MIPLIYVSVLRYDLYTALLQKGGEHFGDSYGAMAAACAAYGYMQLPLTSVAVYR